MDWLRTVIELTDPMIARQAIVDTELLDALDFEVPCAQSLPEWCRADGEHPAHYFMTKLCCGERKPVCAGSVDRYFSTPGFGVLVSQCSCGALGTMGSLRSFTPLSANP